MLVPLTYIFPGSNQPCSIRATELATPLKVFTQQGGLALLAQHLPLVYPESLRFSTVDQAALPASSPDAMDGDWVKVDGCNDAYEVTMPSPNASPLSSGCVANSSLLLRIWTTDSSAAPRRT